MRRLALVLAAGFVVATAVVLIVMSRSVDLDAQLERVRTMVEEYTTAVVPELEFESAENLSDIACPPGDTKAHTTRAWATIDPESGRGVLEETERFFEGRGWSTTAWIDAAVVPSVSGKTTDHAVVIRVTVDGDVLGVEAHGTECGVVDTNIESFDVLLVNPCSTSLTVTVSGGGRDEELTLGSGLTWSYTWEVFDGELVARVGALEWVDRARAPKDAIPVSFVINPDLCP
jgi:hypothetical protein